MMPRAILIQVSAIAFWVFAAGCQRKGSEPSDVTINGVRTEDPDQSAFFFSNPDADAMRGQWASNSSPAIFSILVTESTTVCPHAIVGLAVMWRYEFIDAKTLRLTTDESVTSETWTRLSGGPDIVGTWAVSNDFITGIISIFDSGDFVMQMEKVDCARLDDGNDSTNGKTCLNADIKDVPVTVDGLFDEWNQPLMPLTTDPNMDSADGLGSSDLQSLDWLRHADFVYFKLVLQGPIITDLGLRMYAFQVTLDESLPTVYFVTYDGINSVWTIVDGRNGQSVGGSVAVSGTMMEVSLPTPASARLSMVEVFVQACQEAACTKLDTMVCLTQSL